MQRKNPPITPERLPPNPPEAGEEGESPEESPGDCQPPPHLLEVAEEASQLSGHGGVP